MLCVFDRLHELKWSCCEEELRRLLNIVRQQINAQNTGFVREQLDLVETECREIEELLKKEQDNEDAKIAV